MTTQDRYAIARRIAHEAGALARDYFRNWQGLTVDAKGHQDFVSEADKEVELAVRRMLAEACPDDAVLGEEGAPTPGSSGFTWVIDPIDGTANFINGIPQWCVILACVKDGEVVIGIIHDPMAEEMHHAVKGGGAFCNDRPIRCTAKTSLREGSVGVGHTARQGTEVILRLIGLVCDAGTMFWRNASGGLSLAYVASGRLLGYAEAHMNPWDFLAGHLLVQEAGGRVAPVDVTRALTEGGRVVVGGSAVFDAIDDMASRAFDGG